MDNRQTVLTALGCAGSLAAMLAVASPATAANVSVHTEDGLPTLTQAESNPITDALRCGCASCTLTDMQPAL